MAYTPFRLAGSQRQSFQAALIVECRLFFLSYHEVPLKVQNKLQGRNSGGPLRVLIIGRISTEHQDLENINASFRYVEEYLARVYDGPTEITHLGERASGMLSGRESIRQAEDLIASGAIDVVIAEDLSRIFRNPRHQYNFVQDVVDAETRLICIADNLDTADDSWELMLGAATLRHGLTVSDTRRRVRRTATHSFHHGGMVQKVKFGYRKLTKAEAASGDYGPVGLAIARVAECTPTIQQMMERAKRGDSFVSIAEWLNRELVEPPPYAAGDWNGRLVKDILRDPILKGLRVFRRVLSQPVFKTGHYRRVRNEEPETAHYPELAHIDATEFDQLQEVLDQREASSPRKKGRDHPLYGRPRKRAYWPAQHARCSICGDILYRYDGRYLKCQNATRTATNPCWNHLQVDCDVLRDKLLTPMVRTLIEYPIFRDTIREATLSEFTRLVAHRSAGAADRKNLEKLRQQAANLTQAITVGGQIDVLASRLRDISEQIKVAEKATELQNQVPQLVWEKIESGLSDHVVALAAASFEFCDLMNRIGSRLLIQPVQALDTPQIKPKGRLELELVVDDTVEAFCFEAYLFDLPLHVRHFRECAALRVQKPSRSLKKISDHLGISHMTVKRALKYASLMESEGLDEPYRVLERRPEVASRWKARAGNRGDSKFAAKTRYM